MFCILKNSFKVVLSDERPKGMQIEELGGAMEGCVCVHVTKLEYSLQNFKMYVKMY